MLYLNYKGNLFKGTDVPRKKAAQDTKDRDQFKNWYVNDGLRALWPGTWDSLKDRPMSKIAACIVAVPVIAFALPAYPVLALVERQLGGGTLLKAIEDKDPKGLAERGIGLVTGILKNDYVLAAAAIFAIFTFPSPMAIAGICVLAAAGALTVYERAIKGQGQETPNDAAAQAVDSQGTPDDAAKEEKETEKSPGLSTKAAPPTSPATSPAGGHVELVELPDKGVDTAAALTTALDKAVVSQVSAPSEDDTDSSSHTPGSTTP